METDQETRFCDTCQKETPHEVVESSLEIEYRCEVCGKKMESFKTFF